MVDVGRASKRLIPISSPHATQYPKSSFFIRSRVESIFSMSLVVLSSAFKVNRFFVDQTAFRVGPLAFEKQARVAAAGSSPS